VGWDKELFFCFGFGWWDLSFVLEKTFRTSHSLSTFFFPRHGFFGFVTSLFLSKSQQTQLLTLLEQNPDRQVAKALVFDAYTQTNRLDTSHRQADKTLYHSPDLFDWCESNIVARLNAREGEDKGDGQRQLRFVLLRNHLELIVYQPGGFFAAHHDTPDFPEQRLVQPHISRVCRRVRDWWRNTLV